MLPCAGLREELGRKRNELTQAGDARADVAQLRAVYEDKVRPSPEK